MLFSSDFRVYFRYNITTGQYPFEGDNIYRLLENIGKNQWKAPEWFQKFDVNLAHLILGMLQSNSQNRLTLKQVKQHTYVHTMDHEYFALSLRNIINNGGSMYHDILQMDNEYTTKSRRTSFNTTITR